MNTSNGPPKKIKRRHRLRTNPHVTSFSRIPVLNYDLETCVDDVAISSALRLSTLSKLSRIPPRTSTSREIQLKNLGKSIKGEGFTALLDII